MEVVEEAVECVAPSSALETVLLGIWEELLPREQIGVDQSFSIWEDTLCWRRR